MRAATLLSILPWSQGLHPRVSPILHIEPASRLPPSADTRAEVRPRNVCAGVRAEALMTPVVRVRCPCDTAPAAAAAVAVAAAAAANVDAAAPAAAAAAATAPDVLGDEVHAQTVLQGRGELPYIRPRQCFRQRLQRP